MSTNYGNAGRATTPAEVGALILQLQLEPHPEGGHFRRTYTSSVGLGGRPTATAIAYLLTRGERSHWHRVDAEELWIHQGGDGIELRSSADGKTIDVVVIGSDLARGHVPQAFVPKDAWQSAAPLGAFALAACVVTPGFTDAGFELAPTGWHPG